VDREATRGERAAGLIPVAEEARDRLDGVFLVPRVLGTLNWGTAESVGDVVGLEHSPERDYFGKGGAPPSAKAVATDTSRAADARMAETRKDRTR
jgi:hypothetical protein